MNHAGPSALERAFYKPENYWFVLPSTAGHCPKGDAMRCAGAGSAKGPDAGENVLSDRYTDKPFLRFVDAYVLRAIGHLDEATDSYCKAMVPNLEKSFGIKGTWPEIVEKQMKFPPDLPAQIRRIWEEGKARFEAGNGEAADPVQFAMIFVDRNFGRA